MSGHGRPRHPAHAAAPDELEQARQAARELHEAIKDGRALLREMNAVYAGCNELVATAVGDMNKTLGVLQKHMDEQTELLRQSIRKASREIEQAHAKMLSFDTPEAMIGYIVRQLLDQLSEQVVDTVTDTLPGLVDAAVDKLSGPAARKRRIVAISGTEVLRSLGVEPPPPGAFTRGTPAAEAAGRAARASRATRAVPPPT